MTIENAKRLAAEAANESRQPVAVLDAPVEHAEDESGPYGFCLVVDVRTLYPRATVIDVVFPK